VCRRATASPVAGVLLVVEHLHPADPVGEQPASSTLVDDPQRARVVGQLVDGDHVVHVLDQVHAGIDAALAVADAEAAVGMGRVGAPTVLDDPAGLGVVKADDQHRVAAGHGAGRIPYTPVEPFQKAKKSGRL
jgi:hypothetical protein